jgi:sodium/potassium-transporting ATPase subunit alpha
VETLGSVTVICSDKTGTLTQNLMEVRRLWTPVEETPAGEAAVAMLLKIAGLCNNAALVEGGFRGDPTEAALLRAALDRLGEVAAARLAELPFDTERKRMSTVNRLEGKSLLLTKGALETVLPLCDKIFMGATSEPLGDSHREAVMTAYHGMVDGGLRVMAFAYRSFEGGGAEGEGALADLEAMESSLALVGLIGLEDPVRPEVGQAVATCRQAGIRVMMITGDAGRTALAVARQLGLTDQNPQVVEGLDLERMPDQQLREVLLGLEVIFARVTPRHKMRIVSLLQEEGERVAVTGDGVNDAPALRKADIGIAMGQIGTDVAREAADMLLLDDNFATIVKAIEEGRAVFQNIQKFISYILASNIPEIVPYIAYVLLGIPLPLTILQILAVDLGTDMLPGLALGMEKPSPEVMRQPPRPPGERLLNGKILVRSYLFLGPIEAAAGLFGYFSVMHAGGWQWGQSLAATAPLYLQATTACWGAIVVTQIGNIFACRSFRESVFSLGLFSNPMVLWGIASEVLIAAFFIYHPFGNRILGTAPLPASIWLVLAAFGVILLSLEEIRKWLMRRAG